MDELFLRSNILKRKAYDKKVFIYEDHRYILNVLYRAFNKSVLTEPVTLLYFDKHDDGKDPVSDINTLKKYRGNLPDEKEFWSFVEWEISCLDDDWIKTGMELGLIGDAILIGCPDPINFTEFSNSYKDHLGMEHIIYNVGTIWGGLAYQGWLTDTAQKQKFAPVWDLIGLVDNTCMELDSTKKKTKFVVDFDLDCFTTKLEEFTIPYPLEYFYKLFESPSQYCHIKPSDVVIDLIKEAEFVTVARESDYCGSIQNNNIIFENVNEVIFRNSL